MVKIEISDVGEDDRPTVIGVGESKVHPGRFDVMLLVGNFASAEEAEAYADDLGDLLTEHLGADLSHNTGKAKIVEDN